MGTILALASSQDFDRWSAFAGYDKPSGSEGVEAGKQQEAVHYEYIETV